MVISAIEKSNTVKSNREAKSWDDSILSGIVRCPA